MCGSGVLASFIRSVLCIRITGETFLADMACSMSGDAVETSDQSLEGFRTFGFSSCTELFQSFDDTRRLMTSFCVGL